MRVWVSIIRRGVAYHAVPSGGRLTECGRFHGADALGSPARGVFLTVEEAEESGMHPCKQCDGSSGIRPPLVGVR